MRHGPGSWASVCSFAIVAAALAALPAAATPEYTQNFTLQPGWNSIYLEVQPAARAVESVFSNAACGGQAASIASVWTYDTSFGRVGVPLDPAEGLLNATGWFVHYHSSRPESVISTLYGVSANRAYLIRNDGAAPIVCDVSGEPLLAEYEWEADAFTLTGLHVDPDNSPSFGAFFGPSSRHSGQAVFRLDAGGFWEPVQPFFEPIRAGEAYWIYTDGASRYQGPLVLELNGRARLDFAASLDRVQLAVQNNLDVDTAVRFETVGGSIPLLYESPTGVAGDSEWLDLTGFSLDTPATSALNFSFGPDRASIADRNESVLEINNGLGTRLLVSVAASAAQSTAPTSFTPLSLRPGGVESSGAGGGLVDFARGDARPFGGGAAAADPNSGLWVGTALVDAVEEIRCEPEYDEDTCLFVTVASDLDPGDDDICGTLGTVNNCGSTCVCSCQRKCSSTLTAPVGPQPAGGVYKLRLIVHVDGGGTARLLKEVVQLFKPPTLGPDPQTPGFDRVIDPGEYVLITDESLIPQYTGVALRDGKPVGVRISTVAYDYDGDPPQMGTMQVGGSLAATLSLPSAHPTNPFLHRYHPDHDNKDTFFNDLDRVCTVSGDPCSSDADCLGQSNPGAPVNNGPCIETAEAPAITRVITLNLDNTGAQPRDVFGGTYSEVIEGLHLDAVEVSGTFVLSRVANQFELNPDPAQ